MGTPFRRAAGVIVIGAVLVAAGCAPSVDPLMDSAFYDLVHADSYTDPKNPAVRTLAEMGEPAVPRLIELLRDPERMTRRKAAFALAEMDPPATSAVPALIELLANKDFENWVARHPAAVALGRMGDAGLVAIPALADSVCDESFGVQNFVREALVNLGAPATPIVAAVLDDDDIGFKMLMTLRDHANPPSPELIPHLARWLGTPGSGAYDLLRRIGTPAALAAVDEYERENAPPPSD
jgi:hypothetical protein